MKPRCCASFLFIWAREIWNNRNRNRTELEMATTKERILSSNEYPESSHTVDEQTKGILVSAFKIAIMFAQ